MYPFGDFNFRWVLLRVWTLYWRWSFSNCWSRFLSTAGNAINGTLSDTFGSLTNLVTLDLSRNQLDGTIPSTLGDLSALKYLSLAENKFDSRIPSELGRLELLEKVVLCKSTLHFGRHVQSPFCSWFIHFLFIAFPDKNFLDTPIPSELGALAMLRELNLCK